MKRTRWNDVDISCVGDEGKALFDGTEAGLNLCIATSAHLHGWIVEREVVIPGWGRLDLLLSNVDRLYAVELKLNLTKPAQIRRAFQQADGYRRWLEDHNLNPAGVMLAGQEYDSAAVDDVARLYPGVWACRTGGLLSWIANPSWRDEFLTIAQRQRAHDRLRATEVELDRRRVALADLPMPALPELPPEVEEALMDAEPVPQTVSSFDPDDLAGEGTSSLDHGVVPSPRLPKDAA